MGCAPASAASVADEREQPDQDEADAGDHFVDGVVGELARVREPEHRREDRERDVPGPWPHERGQADDDGCDSQAEHHSGRARLAVLCERLDRQRRDDQRRAGEDRDTTGRNACPCLHAVCLRFLPMRVLVTGGAGFIGSHFAKRLALAGDDVVVLDKLTYSGNRANLEGADVEFFEGDIGDPDAVAAAGAGVEAIVNFAAETHVDRSIIGAAEFIETDVLGTYVLLGFARDAGIRLVQVSTDEVYGDVPEGVSSTEDDPLRPSSPYSASKAGGDLQVLAAIRTFGIDACITRGANTYGPNQYPEKLISLFVTNALDGEALPVYGDGRQQREWIYVADHCAAVELVLREGTGGEVYNVGGEQHENLEITSRILELTGADQSLVRHVDDRPGHDRRYSLDDEKLRTLGWAPQRSLEEGLAETVGWYRDNRAWWEPIKSGAYREYYRQQYAERLGS
jgi:dTDP-glucose 4,6-dehydratase